MFCNAKDNPQVGQEVYDEYIILVYGVHIILTRIRCIYDTSVWCVYNTSIWCLYRVSYMSWVMSPICHESCLLYVMSHVSYMSWVMSPICHAPLSSLCIRIQAHTQIHKHEDTQIHKHQDTETDEHEDTQRQTSITITDTTGGRSIQANTDGHAPLSSLSTSLAFIYTYVYTPYTVEAWDVRKDSDWNTNR